MSLEGDWRPGERGADWQIAELSTRDQIEPEPISVQAFKFPGETPDVALIVGGIHGTELTGVDVAKLLIEHLKPAEKRARLTTIVIPQLFGETRFGQGEQRRYIVVPGIFFRPEAHVDRSKLPTVIEQNRNFPRVGESYATVRARLTNPEIGAELIDYYDRRFEYTLDNLDRVLADMMLAENRILVQLIEQERPIRLATLHGKGDYARLGDGPGFFVDPRGGYSPETDAPWTKAGQIDDELCRQMVQASLAVMPASVLADLRSKALALKRSPDALHPFAGNLLDLERGLLDVSEGTVHYSVSEHARATSLGMWGSAEELRQEGTPPGRPAMPVITVEMARFDGQWDERVMVDPVLQSLMQVFIQ